MAPSIISAEKPNFSAGNSDIALFCQSAQTGIKLGTDFFQSRNYCRLMSGAKN